MLEWQSSPISRAVMPDAASINKRIRDAYDSLAAEDFERRTHFVAGRFENLYVDAAQIDGLGAVLEFALLCASERLVRPTGALRFGFWLNAAPPGHTTSEHTHAELDELLSAVYYVAAPPSSGDLVMLDGPARIAIAPEAGKLVMFPPELPHLVEQNRSTQLRLSIGMNFGPKPKDD